MWGRAYAGAVAPQQQRVDGAQDYDAQLPQTQYRAIVAASEGRGGQLERFGSCVRGGRRPQLRPLGLLWQPRLPCLRRALPALGSARQG